MSRNLRVTHFGNAPGEEGGISTVVENYATWPFPRTEIRTVATYDRDSRARTWGRYLRALALLGLRPRRATGVAHVHLSHSGSLVREGSLVALARLRGVPAVATVHGSVILESSRAFRVATRMALRHARCVTVLAESVAQHLAELGVRHVEVVPNGIPVPPGREDDARPPLVVLGGVLSRRKGVDVLLEAWPEVRRRVPDAQLLLLGPAHDVDLRHHTPVDPRLGIEVPGPQPRQAVRAALRRARVAVLPSRNEAMPMFLLEAMAAGCALVATPVGGIPELFTAAPDGSVPGVLVPVGDAVALAEALVRALDPDVSAQWGASARHRAHDAFSSDVVGSRMEQIWHAASGADRVRPA